MGLIRRAARYELGLYRSLLRWLARRPDVPAGGAAFGFVSPVQALIWVFIAVSTIELFVVHIVLPWETIRLVADALGVWGLVWMFGLLASFKVYPHTVAEAGLRVRRGVSVGFTVPWDAIEAIAVRERGLESARGIQVDGAVLSVVMGGRTNVDVTLRRPLSVRLPTGEPAVTEIRLFADDARGLVERARSLGDLEPGGEVPQRRGLRDDPVRR